MAWSDFATWTLALHTLFFGLCERGQPLFTRVLHGPSFGGSHAVLVIYLFTMLTGEAWSLWGWWLHTAPCLLHWADGILNFRALLKAYSPPMHSTNSWESAAHFGPALSLAASRMALRAWSAGVGYMLLEKIFRATQTQPAQPFEWDWSLHKLLQVSDLKELLPLASTIMAYTAFTHRLFVTPEPSEGKRP